jgi:hypothetical protein
MGQVGFPGLNVFRRVIRGEINPLDKSTVVSIYPRPILESKPTLQPGNFAIDAGSYDKPAILVVGSSSWWKELDDQQPLLEIPVSSVQIAKSIVVDYCNGLLGSNSNDTMPGFFYIPGEWTSDRIKKEKKELLDRANEGQKRWYEVLVKIADVSWARTNGNPLAIGDDMRLAARELGLNGKDWLRDFYEVQRIRCVACGTLNAESVVVCPNCKVVIDPKKFKELGLQFAS